MAANDVDPTTGYPIFLAGEAPDLGVDETTVAQYASDVGNRIIRANLTALNDYDYNRAGLWGHALDTKSDYLHDGTGYKLMHRPATTYTPTLTNITGSPTVVARYSVASGIVYESIVITLNGANIGASPGIALPLNSRTPSGFEMLGQALFRKGGAWYEGGILLAAANRIDLVLKLVSGANINMSTNVNATSPFTWASGDSITLKFQYEAA